MNIVLGVEGKVIGLRIVIDFDDIKKEKYFLDKRISQIKYIMDFNNGFLYLFVY